MLCQVLDLGATVPVTRRMEFAQLGCHSAQVGAPYLSGPRPDQGGHFRSAIGQDEEFRCCQNHMWHPRPCRGQRFQPVGLVRHAVGRLGERQRAHRQGAPGHTLDQPAHEQRLQQPARLVGQALDDIALTIVFEDEGAAVVADQRGAGGGFKGIEVFVHQKTMRRRAPSGRGAAGHTLIRAASAGTGSRRVWPVRRSAA